MSDKTDTADTTATRESGDILTAEQIDVRWKAVCHLIAGQELAAHARAANAKIAEQAKEIEQLSEIGKAAIRELAAEGRRRGEVEA